MTSNHIIVEQLKSIRAQLSLLFDQVDSLLMQVTATHTPDSSDSDYASDVEEERMLVMPAPPSLTRQITLGDIELTSEYENDSPKPFYARPIGFYKKQDFDRLPK